MVKILYALVALLLATLPGFAQGSAMPPIGFPQANGGGSDPNAQFLVLTASPILTDERVFQPQSPLSGLDNGTNYQLSLTTVPITLGGSGQVTRQAAINAFLDAAGISTGSLWYRNGAGNVVALTPGVDGQVLTLAAGVPTWSGAGGAAPLNAPYLVASLDATLTDERALATADTTHITIADGGAGANLTLDVGSKVVLTDTAQNVTGQKTITSPRLVYSATDGLLLRNSAGTADGKIVWPDWAANRTLTIPTDASSSFVMSEGNLTINGVKTFGSAPVLSTASLTSNGDTISFPDLGNVSVAYTSQAQTFTDKTHVSPIMNTSIVLDQSTADYTILWANPGAARDYTIRDVTGNAHFAMTTTTAVYTAGGIAFGTGTHINFTSAGTSGKPLLSQGAGTPTFATLEETGGGTGITSYTAGDLLTVNDAGDLVKLAGGTNGDVLTYDDTGDPNIKWDAASGGGAPTTAEYLVLTLNAGLSAERRAVAGRGLNIDDGGANGDATFYLITGAKGDLVAGTGTTTAGVLNVGTDGQFLMADSGEMTGLKWETLTGLPALPGGSDTQLQYNDGGLTLGGTAGLLYNDSTDVLTITNAPVLSSGTITTNGDTITFPDLGNQSICYTGGAQTLTSKTLTTPVIAQINDANGNEMVVFSSVASAANHIQIHNSINSGTTGPAIAAVGDATNIDLNLSPKGTGVLTTNNNFFLVGSFVDVNNNELLKFSSTASAVNELTIKNNSTTNAPQLQATGGDTDISINLVPKGTGVAQVAGVTIDTASNTLTLTNKTLTNPVIAQINDANGNESWIYTATGSAVNEWTSANAATGNNPVLSVTGGDTNIGMGVKTKGTGTVQFDNAAGSAFKGLVLRANDSSGLVTIRTAGSDNVTHTIPSIGNNSMTFMLWNSATSAQGGVIWQDSNTIFKTSAAGTAGQTLVSNGSSGPVYQDRVITKRKTADESVTSNTTVQADDHLVAAIPASTNWTFVFDVHVGSASATPDFKFNISGPTSSTVEFTYTFIRETGTNAGCANLPITGGTDTTFTMSAGDGNILHITGYCTNSTNAGNITLNWAQDSSSGTATTVQAGSTATFFRQ